MDNTRRNELRRQEHLEHWKMEKKADGKWLSKRDYEKKYSRQGKRD